MLHNIAPLNLHLYRCPPLERDLQIMQVPFAVKTAGLACQHNRVGVFFLWRKCYTAISRTSGCTAGG